MPELVSVNLKNIVLFKDVTLPLNRKGVTVIRGLNKDADRKNTTDNTNAAGKSLLTSALANMIVDTDAVTQDIKSRAKRDYFDKGSEINLVFKDHKDTYKVCKKTKGKGIEYSIEKNGKDSKIRGMQNAEAKLKQLLPYVEQEFFTLYYIDSRRPNPLQFGSPAERMSFFTNLFRLHSYDEIRKQINGMLSGLKNKDSQRLEMILRDIEEIKSDAQKDVDELQTRLDTLLSEQADINKQISAVHKINNLYNTVAANAKTYKSFLALSDELKLKIKTDKDILKNRDKVKQILSEIKRSEKQIELYEEYKKEKAAYEKVLKDLQSKAEELKTTFKKEVVQSYEKDKKAFDKLVDKLKESKREKPEYDRKRYASIQAVAEGTSEKECLKKIESNKENLSDLRSDIRSNAAVIKKLQEVEGCSECPTCYQAINKKQTDKLIKQIESKIKKSENAIRVIEKENEILKDCIWFYTTQSEIQDYEKATKEYKTLKKEALKLKDSLKRTRAHAQAYEKYKTIKEKMSALEKPDEVEKPESINLGDKTKLENWLEKASIIESVFNVLSTTDFEQLKTKYKKQKGKESKLSKKLKKCNDLIPGVSSELENAKQSRKKLLKLTSEKEKLEDSLKDIPVLEMLVDVYSNKGLKLMVIQQIAKMIEKNMNHYAPLIYKEPITFKFDVTENQFNIYMERKYRGTTRISDVRRLSGAEGRGFSFLLPLAILPLIPAKRRLNVMILDEPTVNLDYSTRTLFMNSFIPKLCKVVPHVIVVTPLDDEYPNQKQFTVVKQNGFSTLEGG